MGEHLRNTNEAWLLVTWPRLDDIMMMMAWVWMMRMTKVDCNSCTYHHFVETIRSNPYNTNVCTFCSYPSSNRDGLIMYDFGFGLKCKVCV